MARIEGGCRSNEMLQVVCVCVYVCMCVCVYVCVCVCVSCRREGRELYQLVQTLLRGRRAASGVRPDMLNPGKGKSRM